MSGEIDTCGSVACMRSASAYVTEHSGEQKGWPPCIGVGSVIEPVVSSMLPVAGSQY